MQMLQDENKDLKNKIKRSEYHLKKLTAEWDLEIVFNATLFLIFLAISEVGACPKDIRNT